jgi:signal transduction histidine kinase
MPGAFAEAWAADGSVVARSPGWTGELPARTGSFALGLPDGRSGRAFGLRFVPRDEYPSAGTPPGELTLVLAEGIEDVEAAGQVVRSRFLAFGALALVIVGALTAWSLARGLRPLTELSATLARVDDRNLAVRLPDSQHPAELAAPVRVLNELLARLAESFARERQFTANVSHELRTPLAGLRTLLEVTARAPTPADHATALAIVLQMCTLVESLLMLARLDAGQLELDQEPIALAKLVDDCWRPYAAQARARGLDWRPRIAAGVVVETDREKLRMVIGNLLANAAEYTEAGGWIEVTADGDNDGGAARAIHVIDSGPAIPPAQLARIFDRMWRGDAARSATGVHCGIGLSLARAIADCLGYELTAETRGDGSVCFRLAPLVA